MTPKDYAISYLWRGWLPLPLVERTKRPACKFKHLDKDFLHPGLGYTDPWDVDPSYGVAVLLRPSRLLVVDCDSPAAIEEVMAATEEPCNNIVLSRAGAHFYYSRPDGCPPLRTVQRGTSQKIDVLAAGISAAPGTIHPTGHVYQWAAQGPLQEAPGWAVGMLQALRDRSIAAGAEIDLEAALRASPVDTALLQPDVARAILGQGAPPEDRSRVIWKALMDMVRVEKSDERIFHTIWCSPLGEKPKSRGPRWLADEIARARFEWQTEKAAILKGLFGQGSAAPSTTREARHAPE